MDGYYFAIVRLVVRDGVTVGSLRSVLPASVLVQADAGEDDQLLAQFIVNSEGRILYSTFPEIALDENLLAKLGENGLDKAGKETLEKGLREERNTTISAKLGNRKLMITAAYLDCNGWSLVQAAGYGGVENVSRRLMVWTAVISLVLVFIALAASTTVFLVFLRQGERLRMEEQKVSELAAAFDTVSYTHLTLPTKA